MGEKGDCLLCKCLGGRQAEANLRNSLFPFSRKS